MIQALINRAEGRRPRVAIGSRWKPGHTITIDTVAGTYQEVNPPRAPAVQRCKCTRYSLAWCIAMALSAACTVGLILLPPVTP